MKILVLNQNEVETLLPMQECIDVMADALAALTRGEMYQPLRMIIRPEGAAGLMGLMPAYRSSEPALFGLKTICVFFANPQRGKDAHQGSVLLFSGETGELLALMNASAITMIRTAAVSAVATRLLSREDACELALIGAGVQARSHLAAISCVPLKRARVVSRAFRNAQKFVNATKPKFEFPIEPFESVREALKGADLVVTATTAQEPVLQREWIAPGTHINAVGTYSPAAREIDTATMAAARLYVDRRESALNEAGDYILAAAEGAIGPDHIVGEIGEVLTGSKPGRQSPDEITLFKSLGLAIEDLAAAEHVYRKASQQPEIPQTEIQRVGTWLEF